MNTDHWIDVLDVGELPENDVLGLAIEDRDIALHCVAGALYATDNICTHGQARLCDGFLDGHEIECPLHQGKFDVRDGRPLCDPVSESLRTYSVKVVGTRVYVRLK